eukprot:6427959-Alexandrium_andersonii.AAC.1
MCVASDCKVVSFKALRRRSNPSRCLVASMRENVSCERLVACSARPAIPLLRAPCKELATNLLIPLTHPMRKLSELRCRKSTTPARTTS